MLSKLGRAMGPSFNFPGLTGAEGAEGAEGEGENEDAEAEEENLHTAASAGVYSRQHPGCWEGGMFPPLAVAELRLHVPTWFPLDGSSSTLNWVMHGRCHP